VTVMTRRAFVKRAVLGSVAIGAGLGFGVGAPVPNASGASVAWAAQDEPVFGSWEQIDFDQTIVRFIAPTSGALFIDASLGGLRRSDDGGTNWRAVSLPPGADNATVDPTDHTVLYASAGRELFRSLDDAATWQPITPSGFTEFARTIMPIVSRADPALLYARLSGSGRSLQIIRSRDRGDSWETILDQARTGDWGLRFLLAHPTIAEQVFMGIGYGGAVPP
jgi:photosystem II stability/assembly factor-like uncharacterized protein